MNKLTEKDFIFKRIIPILKKLGFQNVRYVHGIDEYGRDIVFYDIDRFGIQKLYGAQAKLGDISGSACGMIDKIIAQIDDAFRMPYFDTFRGEEKFIAGFYLIISGRYKRNSKEKVRIKCKGKPVYFLDEKDIDNIKFERSKLDSDIISLELRRLKREALSATRCKSPDLILFERKLLEIDLLENYSMEDKIEAFSEIGLEVTLNTDVGTHLLVEQLLWQIAGWENKSLVKSIYGIEIGKRLLETLAETLWTWGVQAVEYRRNKNSIEIILNAILYIAKTAKLIEAGQALNSCKIALKCMSEKAITEDRKDVIDLIKSTYNKLN